MTQLVVFDTDLDSVLSAIENGDLSAATDQLRSIIDTSPILPAAALDHIAQVEELERNSHD